MRIPCAKCGHLHDSTVTPFMYDNIKLDEPNPNPAVFYNTSTGSFKCINCSAENRVKISWTATEGDNKESLRKELEWAEANKLKRAITNTGKVHYVSTGNWRNGYVDPFCNFSKWLGDYWGQPWKLTNKPVTCKNCLSKMCRWMKQESANAPEDTDRVF